jgi:alkylation response protein AidB-like acyl-CoA dehydrogenase
VLDTSKRSFFDESHTIFRESVRRFFAQELVPHLDRWEEQGNSDKAFWLKCGEAGLLCPNVPEQYGGLGLDFTYNAIILEELSYAGSSIAIGVHSDITVAYLIHYGSEEQKAEYLPKMVSGELIGAIGMTEPGAGSDLKALRTSAKQDGDSYVINGSKTYISNGQNAGLVFLAARTGDGGAKGISLILVEVPIDGFERGRNLDKIGQHASDTSELFFNDVRVPVTARIGDENAAFAYMMQQLPQERLSTAVSAQALAQRALDEAIAFTKERKAFGKTVFDFQNTRFTLADLSAKMQVGWAHLDWAIKRLVDGNLTPAEAAAAKLFHTELQWEVCDAALQLHGGAGYMNEYLIARLWRDARVTRIYAGTSEIMKEVIGRAL